MILDDIAQLRCILLMDFLSGVILSMKSMYIDNVVNFPFPTPPPKPNLIKAEKVCQSSKATT
jgi:HrpA-like RNA helicase